MSTHEPVNILLVDDQPAKLLSYDVILSELGENLIKAGSGKEALEQLLKRDIAVVLVDVCMPDLDGFELAALMREHPRFESTAIIFVSAVHLTDVDRLRGYKSGAVDYIPVPVVPELLRAKVKVFAELYRKTRQLEQLNAELEQRVAERTKELARLNQVLERRIEERTSEIVQLQKLDGLGRVTGGVAHDFNNLLAAVLMSLELLRKQLPHRDAKVEQLLDNAIQGAERGAALTKRMLAFARRQDLKPQAVDLNSLIQGMQDLLRNTCAPPVRLETGVPAGLPPVLVDANQLELAVLNLAVNARDAMPQGGTLTIGAREVRIPSSHPSGLEPGRYVCLTVTDTGEGMDQETLKRALEPFFTTKGVGHGTGLGLSMVHGLATQSGGRLVLRSRKGGGTTAELLFPVAAAAAATSSLATSAKATANPATCTVLAVDDDGLVLTGTVAMLEDLGHTVIAASSGDEALDLVRNNDAIDIVVTDHAMPGLTGVQFAAELRTFRPNVPVILATGYAQLTEGAPADLPRLIKPFTQDQLAEAVQKALRSKQEQANVVSLRTRGNGAGSNSKRSDGRKRGLPSHDGLR
jgi:signal transduction histidine kinase